MNSFVLFTIVALVSGVAGFPAQKVDDNSYYTYNMEELKPALDSVPAISSAPVPDDAAEKSDDPGRRNARNFAVMIGPGPGFGLGFPFLGGPGFGPGPMIGGPSPFLGGGGPSPFLGGGGPGPFLGGPGPMAPGFFNNPLRF